MRIKTKDNNGITLLALIITVVLMLILLSVTIYTGIEAYNNSKINKFVSQMQLLQSKIDGLTSDEIEDLELETASTTSQTNIVNAAYSNEEVAVNDVTKYKVITKEKLKNNLDVDNIENDILVNFDTREIVDTIGIKYEGTTYYTQYKLPGGQKVIQENPPQSRTLSFTITEEVDGLNCTTTFSNISINNGSLLYGEVINGNVSDWKSITNYTDSSKTYSMNLTKSGTYKFRLEDNTDKNNNYDIQEIITTTNKPKTNSKLTYNYSNDSDEWAYKNSYVWIPRFAYKDNSIKFIKGNSNIATDNSYINDQWTVPDIFTAADGTELTGIWIMVNSENQAGLNIMTLIDNSSNSSEEI